MKRIIGIRYDAEGRIYSIFKGAPRAAVFQWERSGFGVFLVAEEPDQMTSWIDTTGDVIRLAARPEVVMPTPTAAPWTWDLSTLPAGTTVTIRNEIGDVLEITDLAEPVDLIDAGTYQVRLSPPFPWLALDATIEVSDA
jgi:hypothetical protein